MLAGRRLGFDPVLVHTGQHYDANLSRVFFDELGLPEPKVNLGVGSGSHAEQIAAIMTALEPLFLDAKPDGVVVYGDVNSTLAASLVAAKLQVPVAHVEAGLRSFDRAMPEEINRVVTDALSDILFTTMPEDSDRLVAEGLSPTRVHLVGNSMIDTLIRFRERLDPGVAAEAMGVFPPYGVVTMHRPQNVDDRATAAQLVEALSRVAAAVSLVFPLHPRGRGILESKGIGAVPGLHVVEPLGYLDFMSLVAGAAVVITDSGGLQPETAILGVPCVTVRPNTEWRVTIEVGSNRLVSTVPDDIEQAVLVALRSTPSPADIPLWDGKAGERIAAILAKWPEAAIRDRR